MSLVILLHFIAAAIAPALTAVLGRRAFLLLALAPAASFVWLLGQVGRAIDDGAQFESISWIPALELDLDFTINPLSGILALLVTGVGTLVLVYCAWYFRAGDAEIWRFSAVLTGFAGAMLGLVLADNVYVLYVFWELTTILSFLLIGHNPERRANRRAAMNALLVTTFGGLAMLVGLVIVHAESGTARISQILAAPPSGTIVTIAVALLVVGALSKSALVPFHFWLPGAMAAPTPVSAYLHAAAMVKAGIYLLALLAPVFAGVDGWRPVIVGLGLFTMLVGGLRALRQYDVKLLLAYGTVSQLGFLTAMVGAGTRSAAFAGLALVCAHALFKATLFLVVGAVDRSTGTRDLRELSGLHRTMPALLAITLIAAGSMAGLPPFLGFIAKESGLAAFADLDHDLGIGGWGAVALGVLALGNVLTVAYTARFVWGVFGVKRGVVASAAPPPSVGLIGPPAVLAALTLAGGFAGSWLTPRFSEYSNDFPPGSHEPVLALWHGLNLPLALTVASLAFGIALFAYRRPIARAQQHIADKVRFPDAELLYHAVIRGIDRVAVETTGRTQRGSLPFYLGVILVVLIVIPAVALIRAWDDVTVRGADNILQVIIAAPMILAGIMTVRSRRRLRAVLLVGVTGYGTALLFVAHGAPDLALTQVLVETFLLVTFVLVMRRMPPFFSDRPFNLNRWVRVSIGVLAGTAVAGFALVATNARQAPPVGKLFADPAVSYGGGNNIVNVTLVDIRAWDTLGEISVLAVAATGVASLIFLLTDRSGRLGSGGGGRRWRINRALSTAPERRSVVMDTVARMIFHVVIIYSIYLMLAGHNSPGGGFAGGLIAGLALMIRYLTGGREDLDAAAPVDAGLVLGLGIATAALAGLLPTVLGGGVLQSAIIDIDLPMLGTVHLVTSVFFDIGVYLVVVGLALDVLRSLGGGIDKDIEAEQGVAA